MCVTGGAEQQGYVLAGACCAALHSLERAFSRCHRRKCGFASRQAHHAPCSAAQQGHLCSKHSTLHSTLEGKVQTVGSGQSFSIFLSRVTCNSSGTAVCPASCFFSPWHVSSSTQAHLATHSQRNSWSKWTARCLFQCCTDRSTSQLCVKCWSSFCCWFCCWS